MIEVLKQPAQEPVAWLEPEWGEKICPEVGYEATITDDHPRDLCWIPLYTTPPKRERVLFPTMLRKMWSGGEVQAWLDENVNKEKNT
jgi:hypothetical protein